MKATLVLLTLALALPAVAQEGSKKPEKKPETPEALAKKVKKLEHDLRVARLKVELAELDAQIKTGTAEAALAKSSRELDLAKQALGHFDTVISPTRITEAKIAFDAVKNRAEQAKDEYAELVAMYKQEEFAEMTKELVLKRGRNQLDLAERRLKVQAKKMQDLEKNILPRERRVLSGKAEDAGSALTRARLSHKKTELEIRIAAAEAHHKVESVRSDLAGARNKLAKAIKK